MKKIMIGVLMLALAACPAWAGAAKETPAPTAEAAQEPTATPKPATEKEIRAAFETFLTEERGLHPAAVKSSKITLTHDDAQGGWSATCEIDLDAVTTDYKEWLKAYEGNVGITWNLLSASYDAYGELKFSHPQLVDDEPMPEFPVSQEKAEELARVVLGLQYGLKEKQLDALDAQVFVRSPKRNEDPDYYEYHIQFYADDYNEQGARIWRYQAKVDTQTGQVLSVVHKDDPYVDFAPARR